jgi:hypothetical protein
MGEPEVCDENPLSVQSQEPPRRGAIVQSDVAGIGSNKAHCKEMKVAIVEEKKIGD